MSHQLADFVADAVLATDLEDRLTYWNDAAARLSGWSASEALGRDPLELLRLSFKSATMEEATRQIAQAGRWTGIVTQVTKDGRTIACDAIVARLPDGQGRVIVLRDLAEWQVLTDRALRVSQVELRKLSRAIEQNPSSVFITNRSGDIEYVNPSFSAMTGYAPEDVIGHKPRMFKTGENLEETYRVLWSTISEGGTWRGELCNKGKTGDVHWVRATISPIFDDLGTITHFVAIEEQIDAEKAAKEAAREADRRFIGAQRMEGIGQLAGGIAHDFNNLLTAILGYSDLVLAAVTDNPALTSDVGEIKKAGERAARLTRELLAFSRKQRLEPRAVNVNQIVGALTKMVERVIGENIHVNVATDAALGLAMLDPAQTEQMVMNLVMNARDAMPDGGLLSIGTANVEVDQDFVRSHPGARAGPHVALRVSDTGIGMDPEVVARVFEPFFTTKPLGQGTGLGLATVYGIVKQSSGYITVDSEVGAGTTFTIYFPRLGAGTAVRNDSPSGQSPLHGTETILVAEDETGLRQVVQRALTRYGYTVLLASDGIEALAAEQRHTAPIHLLLTDVIMPEMGGPELAQHMVRRRPQIKVLFMSGFEYRATGQTGGVDIGTAFLPKPFTPDELARKVRDVLNQPG